MLKEYKKDSDFNNIVSELTKNDQVNKMRGYRQHFDTSCFDHCYMASYYTYLICKRFNLDYKSATRAAMLHDFFLYDWRQKNSHKGLHAFNHGKIAYTNASKIFYLNEKEKDIIIKHMWPVTISLPKYKESYVLTLVDKYCAIEEGVRYYVKNMENIFKTMYTFIGKLVKNL